MQAVVKNIIIYPIKSLDGVSLNQAQFGPGGCLLHDREFAMRDEQGRFVNGKSTAQVHLLRSKVDFEAECIGFRHEQETQWHTFHLHKNKTDIDEYLSGFFKKPVKLVKSTGGEFLDVPVKSGITLLSTASLQTVAGWYAGLPLEESRKRFRANIEVSDVPAFWEDRLFYKAGTAVEFRIGDVILLGLAPRARCVVPTRHPATGESIRGFQKLFAENRNNTAPGWSSLHHYDHAYYLSVDCYVPPAEFGKWIKTGDAVSIVETKSSAGIIS